MRKLAIITLLVATPIVLLKLPWLPVTILEFLSILRESEVEGSIKYTADRDSRFLRLVWALTLYFFGILALLGLTGNAFLKRSSLHLERVAWICSIIVGISLPFFEVSGIGGDTDRVFVFIVMRLPIFIAVISALGLFHSMLYPNSNQNSEQVTDDQSPTDIYLL